MGRSVRFVITAMATLISTISLHAETYTLEKSIETALRNNYGLIAARNAYDATYWRVYSAYGQILPSVSVSTSRSENWSPSYYFEGGIPIPVQGPLKTVRYGGSLNFSQSYVGLGLGTYANIRLREAERRYSYYNYVNETKDLVFSIKEAYFNLAKTKLLVGVAEDAVERSQEQLKVAQSRYDLGSASLSDVLKSKVNYNNAELELITANNNYSVAMADLDFRMGIDVQTEIEVVEDLEGRRTLDVTYGEALGEATERNPSLQRAQFDLAMAQSQLTAARAQLLPTLQIGLFHSTNVDEMNRLLDFQKPDAGYRFSLGLSFNIFNNFADMSNIVTGRKTVDTKQENVGNTRNAIALEVKQAYLEVQKNSEQLRFTEAAVAAAQQDVDIVNEKYKLGAATILEVLDAELSLKQAQVNQVQALFDYNLAISRLEKAMGR